MVFTNKEKDQCNFYVPLGWKDSVWKEFLEICARENSSGSENLRTHIEDYVQKHRGGNPQLLISTFVDKPKKKCFRCEGLFPNLQKVEFISGLIAMECPSCLKFDRERGVVKKVLGVV